MKLVEPSLSEQTYETLREAILTGRIPGDTLWSDREIAARMQFSRTPIRDAVQRLAAEGLVEVIPRRGTRVLPLRTEDVREIHQIARALELEAATIIARLPERDLSAIEAAVIGMEEAIARADREEWVVADAAFHHAVVHGCGNGRLARLYDAQRSLTDRARYFALYLRELPVRSAEEHREMLNAIKVCDATRLATLYREHWDRTTKELLELVERHGTTVPVKAQ
ncbi:MAG: GntR family transcriptional regulator [Pseudomonadota bacterium]